MTEQQLINHQLQVISELLLVIAGEFAILNANKHLKAKTNITIANNIIDLAKDVLNNKNIISSWIN